jgi:phosphatidylinositol glycan class B
MGCRGSALKRRHHAEAWHGTQRIAPCRVNEIASRSGYLDRMVDLTGIQRASSGFPADGAHSASVPVPLRSEHPLAVAGLAVLLVAAIGLRLVPVIFVPSINWWDEIFQATEQAHRLVFGYGLIPWEFQLGARSWLLPGFVAGLLELSRAIGDGPDYYLPLIATTFAALGAVPVFCCFQWCRRRFGLTGAFLGAALVAAAPEMVYFGARVLSEVIAAHLLVVAYYLLEPGYTVNSRRRIMAAGALFGLVCLLRVQLAPAVAIIALWWVWGAWWRTRLVPLVAGGLVVLVLGGGVLDWATLGYPFASVWRYVLYNIFYGVSSGFGTQPWNYYLLGELGLWTGGAAFVVLLVGLGAWRMPVLLVAAVTIIAVHSGIGHKEYRFIYPAMQLTMILAGVGLAQLADWGATVLRRRGIERGAVAASAVLVLGYWGVVAFNVWTGPTMLGLRQQLNNHISAAFMVARLPALCGLGLYGSEGRDWAGYGGYTYLHRPLPIYWPSDTSELVAEASAFNTLIYTIAPPRELGFETTRCFGPVCVAERPGGCAARPMAAMPFPDSLVDLAPPKDNFEAIPGRLSGRVSLPAGH